MYKKIVNKYIKEVQSGKLIVCQWVKLSIDRHLSDLERNDIYFSEDAANRFLKFSALCKYTKGELASQGKNVEFTPQQVYRYWVLMGWLTLDNKRRFRKVYFEVARKNGKSEEAAILCAYLLLFDKEFGAEIYTAATSYKQARLVFDAAREIIKKLSADSEKVKALVTLGKFNVAIIETNSKLEPISSNDDKQDGLNPHGAVVDEYHAHKDSQLLEVIQTGMGSRSQPMLFIITTAGFEKQYPCYSQERKIATEVLLGVKKDDSLFTVIYTLDEEDDWKDEKTWIKANPNIGITPTWEYMRQQCQQAINQGVHKEVQFKTKNLNIWTNSSMAWITDDKWMQCATPLPDLTGRECYAGLDLAAVSDMNAYVLVFPPLDEHEPVWILPFFWIPKSTIERKNEIGNFRQWQRDGFIKECGEDVINQKIILNDILEIHKKYDVKTFAFDRFMAYNGLIQGLQDEGIEGFEFGQGFVSMSQPTKELEVLTVSKNVAHGGNPVLRWHMGNIELRVDPADNIKIDKAKSREKVDGAVALVMALGVWKAYDEEDGSSIYEDRGLIIL
ncbi:MAG: terminase large subunit [Proteobacteria bacterium]|nr:terminase large subunit [Pseudomonadota bacterium]